MEKGSREWAFSHCEGSRIGYSGLLLVLSVAGFSRSDSAIYLAAMEASKS